MGALVVVTKGFTFTTGANVFYYLFNWINKLFLHPPGGDLIRYLTIRAALSAMTALAISLFMGPRIISMLKNLQISDTGKTEAPKEHLLKAGTPTMGGIIILL